MVLLMLQSTIFLICWALILIDQLEKRIFRKCSVHIYSIRPSTFANFQFSALIWSSYERNGRAAIRVASWNLDRMCVEKSSNLGVREVVCRTIFENCLSILCVQEIYEAAALQAICDELNCPKLRRCIEWKDNSRNWKWTTNITDSESIALNGLGLIYDANRCEFLVGESFDIFLGDGDLNEVNTNVAVVDYKTY